MLFPTHALSSPTRLSSPLQVPVHVPPMDSGKRVSLTSAKRASLTTKNSAAGRVREGTYSWKWTHQVNDSCRNISARLDRDKCVYKLRDVVSHVAPHAQDGAEAAIFMGRWWQEGEKVFIAGNKIEITRTAGRTKGGMLKAQEKYTSSEFTIELLRLADGNLVVRTHIWLSTLAQFPKFLNRVLTFQRVK